MALVDQHLGRVAGKRHVRHVQTVHRRGRRQDGVELLVGILFDLRVVLVGGRSEERNQRRKGVHDIQLAWRSRASSIAQDRAAVRFRRPVDAHDDDRRVP